MLQAKGALCEEPEFEFVLSRSHDRHPGLDPGSRFLVFGLVQKFTWHKRRWIPDQVRDDFMKKMAQQPLSRSP